MPYKVAAAGLVTVAVVVSFVIFRPGDTDRLPVPTSTATTADTTTSSNATSLPTTSEPDAPGPLGIGDPYYPLLGNPGLDIEHYSISLEVDPETGEIGHGLATIEAMPTDDLDWFSLDFRGLEVLSASVDGTPVETRQLSEDLIVTPQRSLPAGETLTIVIEYRGTPQPAPVEALGTDWGWVVEQDGLWVMAEPAAAHTWFPGNDHPSDKATFSIELTVPSGYTAVSNGELVEEVTEGQESTFRWHMGYPMATYLATAVIGHYERVDTPNPGGVPLRDYIPEDFEEPPQSFGRTAEIMLLFEDWFGPYPFDQYGHVVITGFPGALEAQTMSLMGRGALSVEVVAHELAHQWFGDSVSPASWQDIWLNEGFATFGEFLWLEEDRGFDVMEAYARSLHRLLMNTSDPILSDPGTRDLFDSVVYWRGGLTLHALRLEVGDATMRAILQSYAERFQYANASTADFISVAEEVSGRDLSDFFSAWLDEPSIPPYPEG
jgi:aminopeptidase N